MRFLADESCDAALGQALLEAGNDVLEVRDAKPGADDEWVVSLAVSENRMLCHGYPETDPHRSNAWGVMALNNQSSNESY